jgi:hypothetical protein
MRGALSPDVWVERHVRTSCTGSRRPQGAHSRRRLGCRNRAPTPLPRDWAANAGRQNQGRQNRESRQPRRIRQGNPRGGSHRAKAGSQEAARSRASVRAAAPCQIRHFVTANLTVSHWLAPPRLRLSVNTSPSPALSIGSFDGAASQLTSRLLPWTLSRSGKCNRCTRLRSHLHGACLVDHDISSGHIQPLSA